MPAYDTYDGTPLLQVCSVHLVNRVGDMQVRECERLGGAGDRRAVGRGGGGAEQCAGS